MNNRTQAWNAYQCYVAAYEAAIQRDFIAHRHQVAILRKNGANDADMQRLDEQYAVIRAEREAVYLVEAAQLRKAYADLVECEKVGA